MYKYPGNPVFYGGSAEDWDYRTYTKAVIYDGGKFHMWYFASDINRRQKLGYASSKDGIHWEKYHGNPLNFKTEGGWERTYFHFNVVKADSMYYLLYMAYTKDTASGISMGLARSKDGLNWDKVPEPVFAPEAEKGWKPSNYASSGVLYHHGKFHMWYTGMEAASCSTLMRLKTGYATSQDGINWNRYHGNPIFSAESAGFSNVHRLMVTSVVYNGSGFDMWYMFWNGICWQIGHAASRDGLHWINTEEYPVVAAGDLGSWDSWHAASPYAIFRDSVYHLWYNGQDKRGRHYGYATTSVNLARAWEQDSIYAAPKFIWVRIFNREERIATDSLEHILSRLSGKDKADGLNKLALAYSLYKPEKSAAYARQALSLSNAIVYPQGKAMALFVLGNSQYVLHNYTEALRNQLHALRIYDSLNMQVETGNIYSQIASIQTYAGSHDLASRYHEKALKEFNDIHDTLSIIRTLDQLGYSRLRNGDTTSAIKTFNRHVYYSLQTRRYAKLAEAYEALGKCYTGMILDSAIYFIETAAVIWDSLIMRNHLSYNNLLLAEAYEAAGPEYYEEAHKYYFKSVNDRRRSEWFGVRLYYRLAHLEFKMGNYAVAQRVLNKASLICRNWLKRQDHRMFAFLNDKLEFERDHVRLMGKIYLLYYYLDRAHLDDKKALEHYMLATQWKDSIQDNQSRKQWALMQGEYETERAENKIVVLEKENEVSRMKIRQSRVYILAMGAFVLILVLIAILFVRQNKIRAEHRNVLLEQKMLRLQMNPHFIFNALSGIMEFIDNKMNDVASKYLSTFASLMRSTLESTRKDFIYLEEEVSWLSNYMELQKLRYTNNFQYSISVDDELDPGDVRIPPMLIQPFVENAIEHGIRHKNAPGHISVSFRLHNNMIKCEVEDDGVGRAKAWEIEHKTRKKHTSMATDIILDRIRAINKKLKHKIRLDIVDIISDSNEAIGTRVILDMPYI